MSDLHPDDNAASHIIKIIPNPILMVALDGYISYANDAAQELFQASSGMISKLRISDLMPFGSPVLMQVEQIRERRAPVNEYRMDISTPRTLRMPDGESIIADVFGSLASGSGGEVVLAFQMRTIAEKIDRQLNHRGAARTVTGLAAMLAHEIKNPLSGIRGAAQLLEHSIEEEDQPLTKLIMDETDRIVRLVNRMEVFSDESPIDRDPVNVHSVFNHVKRLAENGFAKGIRIIEQYDPSLPPVEGSRDQLIQVFMNLIKNAAEATEGKEVREIILTSAYRSGISIAAGGTRERVTLPLEFCVIDNGNGIPDDIQQHMFDPFVTTKTNGTGLGLALVAKIIGDHGGVIECDSKKGRTRFRILLPAFVHKKEINLEGQTE